MAKTLDSLREQTWENLETIIINDGSTELETLDFLSGIQDEFRVINQENKGLPAARNRGFAEASGEYILPLDCDDWLEPTAVEKLFAALRTGGSKSFAYPQMILEGELSGETKIYPNHVGAVHAIDSEDTFSTISKEMKNNEALQVNDIKEFYTYMTDGWPAKPDNWEEIIAYNLK